MIITLAGAQGILLAPSAGGMRVVTVTKLLYKTFVTTVGRRAQTTNTRRASASVTPVRQNACESPGSERLREGVERVDALSL